MTLVEFGETTYRWNCIQASQFWQFSSHLRFAGRLVLNWPNRANGNYWPTQEKSTFTPTLCPSQTELHFLSESFIIGLQASKLCYYENSAQGPCPAKQARKPQSYASLKLWPTSYWVTESPSHRVTGVECRSTSVPKNRKDCRFKWMVTTVMSEQGMHGASMTSFK